MLSQNTSEPWDEAQDPRDLELEIRELGIENYLQHAAPNENLPTQILNRLPEKKNGEIWPFSKPIIFPKKNSFAKWAPCLLSAAALLIAFVGFGRIPSSKTPAIPQSASGENIEIALYRFLSLDDETARLTFHQNGNKEEVRLKVGQIFKGHRVVNVTPNFISFDSKEGQSLSLYAATDKHCATGANK